MAAPTRKTFHILLIAAWIGLAVGLLEGAILFGLQRAGFATWNMIRDGVDARILIVSPLFDLVLFCCFGLVWFAVATVFRKRDVGPWGFGFLILAGAYALLASTGRLNDLACTLLALGLATQAALRFRKNSYSVFRFMRRSALILLGLVFLAGSYAVIDRHWQTRDFSEIKRPDPYKDSPNILLVVLDTARADHLGAYGYPRATSPNIDNFARHGVVFENAYASSSWTLPSHASLFTNLYSFQNHVDPWFLAPQFQTLAEVLGDDHYSRGAAVGNTYWCNYATGIAQGFQYNGDYFHNLPDAISRTLFGRKAMEGVLHLFGYYRNPAKKTAGRVNEEILGWLDARPSRQRQFFAFLNYYDAHEPCFPPAPYDGRFAPAETIRSRKPLDTHLELPDPVPPDRLRADLDAYDSTLAYVDSQLGALWAELERRGLTENTLLIVTSDHGHSFGEGGVYGHRTSLRREQIHVPLVFYWQGHLPEGVRVTQPVSQIHIPATVTDLAGYPGSFPGKSLAVYWRDPTSAPEETVLAELARPRKDVPAQWPVARGDMKTLVTDRWQYLEWADGKSALFDFLADPQEEHDVSQTTEGRTVAATLRAKLQSILSSATVEHARGQPRGH